MNVYVLRIESKSRPTSAQCARRTSILCRRIGIDFGELVPPVGVLGDGAQQVLLAVAADHDRRRDLGSRLAIRVAQPIPAPFEIRRRIGPERPDGLDPFDHLLDAYLRRREFIAVGQVFIFGPAGAVAEDEAAVAEHLEARRPSSRAAADGGTSSPSRSCRAAGPDSAPRSTPARSSIPSGTGRRS